MELNPIASFPLCLPSRSSLLPEELAARIGRELRLLACPPWPTKLNLQQCTSKAASVAAAPAGGGSEGGVAVDGLPLWVAELMEGEHGAALGQWQPAEVRCFNHLSAAGLGWERCSRLRSTSAEHVHHLLLSAAHALACSCLHRVL